MAASRISRHDMPGTCMPMRPTSPIAQLLSSRSLAGAVEIGGHRQLEEVAALKPLGEEQDLEALDVPALRVEPRDDVVPQFLGLLLGIRRPTRDMENVGVPVVPKSQLRRHSISPTARLRVLQAVTIQCLAERLCSLSTTTTTCRPDRTSVYHREKSLAASARTSGCLSWMCCSRSWVNSTSPRSHGHGKRRVASA